MRRIQKSEDDEAGSCGISRAPLFPPKQVGSRSERRAWDNIMSYCSYIAVEMGISDRVSGSKHEGNMMTQQRPLY